MPTERDFASAAREHQPKLFRTACFLTGTPHEAESLVQETLVDAWRDWDRFEGSITPHTWFYRILSNRYRRWQHSQMPRWRFFPFRSSGDSKQDSKPVSPPKPANALITQNQQSSQLWAMLRSLTPNSREAMVLRYAEGMNPEQIAETLQVPVATVKSRLCQAHAQLSEKIKRAMSGKARA